MHMQPALLQRCSMDVDSDGEQQPLDEEEDDAAIDVEADEETDAADVDNDAGKLRPPTAPPADNNNSSSCLERNEAGAGLDSKSISQREAAHSY